MSQLCLTGGASANTFNANAGLGGIPDGAGVGPASYGDSRDVAFPVSGLGSGAPLKVAVTMVTNHNRVGDLDVVLRAPSGQEATIFSRTGAGDANDFGASANLDGTYTFTDSAPSSPTWWQTAAAVPDGGAVPIGNYPASAAGPAGGSNTTILSSFTTVSNMNGTWLLKIKDGASGNTGSISFASLELVGTVLATPTSLGDIPDAPPGSAPGTFTDALKRDVQFTIGGLARAAPSAIVVSMTFEPDHTFVGDLDARLIAPDGTTRILFNRTGATTDTDLGDSSNLDGPYTFLDIVGAFNWWSKASTAGPNDTLTSGAYRALRARVVPAGLAPTLRSLGRSQG